jgi:UDP-2,3-diacylglucosamine pyrophosphatase LpxH
MKVEEGIWRLKEWGLSYLEREVRQDYDKFARQDFIAGEVPFLDQDHLIPGHLHEPSVWNLKQKYRYEVSTPWETQEGEVIEVHTVITSDTRLTPNEVYEAAADHPSLYAPEEGVFRGDMAIEGVWFK